MKFGIRGSILLTNGSGFMTFLKTCCTVLYGSVANPDVYPDPITDFFPSRISDPQNLQKMRKEKKQIRFA
jgi:hypothetical protein